MIQHSFSIPPRLARGSAAGFVVRSVRPIRLALAALGLLATGVSAADLHVDAILGADGNDGSSWALSVRTIGRAMVLSRGVAGPERILVAQGTYIENVALDQVDTQLLGGHPTGGGARDPVANPTILDGGGLAPVVTISADSGLTAIDGIVVDGFTIRNGRQIDRIGILGGGAGIFLEEAQATITNNVFTSNVIDATGPNGAGIIGAAMYVYRANARASTITGNLFENNEARNANGGAIAIVDIADAVTSIPIEFSGNTVRNNRALALPGVASTAAVGAGGGIYAWKGKPLITNNLIESNLAEDRAGVVYAGQGGGLFIADASPIITGNVISSNVARGLDGDYGGSGGGMYGFWSTATRAGSQPTRLTSNTFDGNRAEGGSGLKQSAGGGVALYCVGDTEISLTDTTFTNNSARGGGTGSAVGGGLFAYMRETGPAYLTIDGGSFEANKAALGGGGAFLQGGRAGRVGITGLLVKDNEADYGSGLTLSGDGVARNLMVRGNRVYDPDGDAVSEIADNCPGLANGVQSDADGDGQGDACDPDDDEDGTPDAADPCPLVATGGCAGDADGDGDLDGADNCPLVANPTQADASLDGVGDACEPARFDALATRAGGISVQGDATLTNLEIVENMGHGLQIIGAAADVTAGTPENPSSAIITNVTIAMNQAAGLVTYLADGTLIRDSILARNLLSDALDRERTGGIPSSPNVTCNDVYKWDGLATWACTGAGNMDSTDGDTFFIVGPLGGYYLGQTAAGQSRQFVGVDAGGVSAAASDVSGRTTRTDAVADADAVDLGFHYPLSVVVVPPDSLTASVRVGKDAAAVLLSLVAVAPSVTAVRWYRGSIDLLDSEYSHATPFTGVPGMPECSGPPTAIVFDPASRGDGNDWYYLAVQLDAGVEGSFGTDSLRALRPRPEDQPADRVTNGCP